MILCPKCKTELPAPFINQWVVCLNCEHKWELNEDHTAIKSATIEIEDISQDSTTKVGA